MLPVCHLPFCFVMLVPEFVFSFYVPKSISFSLISSFALMLKRKKCSHTEINKRILQLLIRFPFLKNMYLKSFGDKNMSQASFLKS